MKIDQIPIGGRFSFRGKTYTKVGPMTASADAGGTQFIPKHAALVPLAGELSPPLSAPKGKVDAARIGAAFETYHQAALAIAGEDGRAALEAARERFFADLG